MEPVTLVERSCFSNCIRMIPQFERIAGRELHIIAGSLGLCSSPPVHYEWGGWGAAVHERVVQFTACRVTGAADVHFWLSTSTYGEDGIVFDVIDPYLFQVAHLRKKQVCVDSFMHGCGIIGRTIGELEACGLRYVAAAPLVQEILVRRHSQRLMAVNV